MKNKKFWGAASLACVILGIALTGTGRLLGGYPGFYIDHSGVYAAGGKNAPDPLQDTIAPGKFDSMEIHADYADVELVLSDRFAVEYCVRGSAGNPVCEVRNGRLIFQEATPSKNYGIGFFTFSTNATFFEPRYYVKVMIPEDMELSEAIINIESGDLDIPSIQADTLKITDEYGDVAVDKCKSDTLDIRMEGGTLALGTADASQTTLENEYGEIKISEATGSTLTLKMESGGLKAGRLDYSDTEIAAEYGNVTIKEMSGEHLEARLESGNCRIDWLDCTDTKLTDSYGDIRLGLPEDMGSYGFDLKTEYGYISIGDRHEGYDSNDSSTVYMAAGNGERMVTAVCESGDIEIRSVN